MPWRRRPSASAGGGAFCEHTAWPEFHNGVAAGLRLAPSGGQLSRTWIVYNKPEEPSYTHAGLLMALGLTGGRGRAGRPAGRGVRLFGVLFCVFFKLLYIIIYVTVAARAPPLPPSLPPSLPASPVFPLLVRHLSPSLPPLLPSTAQAT